MSNRPTRVNHAPILLVIVAICAVMETVLTLASIPAIGLEALRGMAFMHGAFWVRLMSDWEPIFAVQPGAMYLTYAFLHGSFLHMLFNMLMLLHLGRESVARLGSYGFALLFAVTSIGGAVCFALLTTSDWPMLGASGVVFGLFGATGYWDFQRRRAIGASMKPVRSLLIGLVIMNVVLALMLQGSLAWQTHLGGFISGVVFAHVVTPTLRHRFRHQTKPARTP